MAKLVYSVLLIALACVLVREVYIVWWDSQFYVGKFQYFADGKLDDDAGKSFSQNILAQHHMLKSANRDDSSSPSSPSDTSLTPAGGQAEVLVLPTLADVTQWKSALSDVELKIQGFDFGKVLSAVREWVSPPAEVGGYVEKVGNVVNISVSLPRGVRSGQDKSGAIQFYSGPFADDATAAFAVAASIIWVQASQQSDKFKNIPRSLFVSFMLALREYRILRTHIDAGIPLTDDDKKHRKAAQDQVDKLTASAKDLPEIWLLQSRLIGAIGPDETLSDSEAQKASTAQRNYLAQLGSPAAAHVVAAATGVAENVVRLGKPIWLRGPPGSGVVERGVTVTAIVEVNGAQMILAPGYVLSDFGGGDIEISLDASGKPVLTTRYADVIQKKNANGDTVVLIPLKSARFSNSPSDNPASPPIKEIADVVPTPNKASPLVVRQISSHGIVRAEIVDIKNGVAITNARVTGPGDGGAPILDSENRLIAMAYLGIEDHSGFLLLKWLVDAVPGIQIAGPGQP